MLKYFPDLTLYLENNFLANYTLDTLKEFSMISLCWKYFVIRKKKTLVNHPKFCNVSSKSIQWKFSNYQGVLRQGWTVPYRVPSTVRRVSVTPLMEPVKVVSLDITERTVPNRVPRTAGRVSVASPRELVLVVSLDTKDLIVAKVRGVSGHKDILEKIHWHWRISKDA